MSRPEEGRAAPPGAGGAAPIVSVVVPMMNEADGLDVLFSRLWPVLDGLGVPYEVVCVNDGSTDDTLAGLLALRERDPRIVVVDLSRNFGKEAALTAGLVEAEGRAVIPLDADLQDPPEVIPALIEAWEGGAEVVLAVRRRREGDSWPKRATARAFYALAARIADTPIPPDAGDFRLMDRAVVDALGRLPERSRFNKGLFAWLGFRTVTVDYERPLRARGGTKWSYGRLFRFAVDGITSFSSFPLRVWSYVGMIVAGLAFLYGLFIVLRTIVFGIDLPGYASLLAVNLFSTGIVLIGLGVIGEYLARVFLEVKQRPLYIVRETYREQGGTETAASAGPG